MPKDKKKKDKHDDAEKKGKKGKHGAAKATKTLKALAQNPLVADVVAAALVGMAAALKDSDKAKRMAAKASDQLGTAAKRSGKQGSAMWDLALDVGRHALEALADEATSGKRNKSR